MSDALSSLQIFHATAERYGSAAASYLQLMAAEPRVAPEPGRFFVAFNGSLVFVARRSTECTCPACQARRSGGLAGFLAALAGAWPEIPDCADPAEGFRALVIVGGHGIAGVPGCGPGDAFAVDAQGLAAVPGIDESDPVIGALHVGLAGLSLRRHAVLVMSGPGGVIHWS